MSNYTAPNASRVDMSVFGAICDKCGDFYGTSVCVTCAAPGAVVVTAASLTSASSVVRVDNRAAFAQP